MAKKLKTRQQRPRRTLDSPDQILSFKRWCQINDISPRTGFRILASLDRPTVTRLAACRIGITVGANRAWQVARARG
jgi:hypothetical protein